MHATVQSPVGRIVESKYFLHHGVFYVIIHIPNKERLARQQIVFEFHLPALAFPFHNHRSVHISHISHCGDKIPARQLRLHTVIYHRLLADIPQFAVNPFRSVPPGERVSTQRNLEQREPSGVGFLPHILPKHLNVHVLVVTLYLHI